MRKILLLIGLLILAVPRVTATPQIRDLLVIKSDTLQLLGLPLEKAREFLESRYDLPQYEWSSTGCYRGYQATWTLEEDRIYLTGIMIDDRSGSELSVPVDLCSIFGDDCVGGKVFAYWISGNLFAQYGNVVFYNHSVGSVLEFEKKIGIYSGRIVSTEDYPTIAGQYGSLPITSDGLEEVSGLLLDRLNTGIRWPDNESSDNTLRDVTVILITDGENIEASIPSGKLEDREDIIAAEILRIAGGLKWAPVIFAEKPLRMAYAILLRVDVHNRIILAGKGADR